MGSTHFSGPVVSDNGFTGDVTGDITGDLTGEISTTVIIPSTTATATAGAVAITGAIHEITTDGANALTLVDGTEGQHLFVVMVATGGDGTLTPDNFTGGSTITFAAAGDSVHLLFTAAAWYVVAGNGVVIA